VTIKLRDTQPLKGLVDTSASQGATLPNRALVVGLKFSNLAVLIALVAFFAIAAPGFVTTISFTNILNATAVVLLVALGETFIIIGAGIDLSVGSMLSLGGMASGAYLSAAYLGQHGSAVGITIIGVLIGAGVGAAGGVLNGAVIAFLRLNPLIVTLGTYGIFLGVADLISNGLPIENLPPSSFTLGNGTIIDVPYIAIIAFGFAAVLALVAKNTRFGIWTYAVGSNRESVRRAGVNLKLHSMLLYGLCGMLAGLAGMLNAAHFASAESSAGANDLLIAIAAVVIGGTPITGGDGRVWGTVVGALIYTLLENGFVLMNIAAFWQLVVIGALVMVAVFVDNYQRQLRAMYGAVRRAEDVVPPGGQQAGGSVAGPPQGAPVPGPG
jgi:ribose transport system permease protein